MKSIELRPILIILFLLFVQSGSLPAMGVREDSKAYKSELRQVFYRVIDEIYRSETDAVSAKDSIKALRTKYRISYTDEAGILDAIIDRADEQTLTYEETHFYFGLLQDGKLMRYRQEAYGERSEQYKRELILMLKQQLESYGPEMNGASELLTNLNNYYDFVGLEYDEEYFRLKELILSLNEGDIEPEDLVSGLEAMDRELVRRSNLREAQEQRGQLNDRAAGKQPAGGSQPVSGERLPDVLPQQPGTGAGGQKPPDTGTGPHK